MHSVGRAGGCGGQDKACMPAGPEIELALPFYNILKLYFAQRNCVDLLMMHLPSAAYVYFSSLFVDDNDAVLKIIVYKLPEKAYICVKKKCNFA